MAVHEKPVVNDQVERRTPFSPDLTYTFSVWKCLLLVFGISVAGTEFWGSYAFASTDAESLVSQVAHRSPVDLIISEDETWAVTVNQTSNTLSLIDLGQSRVVDEIAIGERPVAITTIGSDTSLLVTCSHSGELIRAEVKFPHLEILASMPVHGQPHGVVVDPTHRFVYVALTDLDQIAVIDLHGWKIINRIGVGRWPRYIAISAGGSQLAVGTSGDRGVSFVDLHQSKLLRIDRFVGLNIGHMAIDPKTDEVYFPWMVYRRNPITPKNIQLGWVMASRLGRVRLGSEGKREAISLDPPGEAIADPHGIALNSNSSLIAITSSGTHELILLGNESLPFTERGSTDHIVPEVLADTKRFRRLDLGGRPMAVRIGKSDRFAYVANYLNDQLQLIDLKSATVVDEISLGTTPVQNIERQGEAIFYDARRSLDQWYSCHSCHYDGGTNAVSMDTMNDGTHNSFKSIPALYELGQTGPWTWHGWQANLDDSLIHSLRTTMLVPQPEEQDAVALAAYFAALKRPPQLPPQDDAESTRSVERGRLIFHGVKGACAKCHVPPYYTDGLIHDFGDKKETDLYSGYNTPSLLGVFRKTNLGHEGGSADLEDFLTGPHSPDKVEGEKLNQSELADLLRYLKTL